MTDFAFERWPELDVVFSRAMDLEGVARACYLDEACTGPEMRAEVEALLVSEERSRALFSDPGIVGWRSDEGAEPPGPGLAGRTVGAYRLLEVIGRGGTAVVYRGERADAAFRQRVAVKVLDRSRIGHDSEARFRQERQILAALEHPNIARLLDGGITDDGYAFIAMELVEGQPIDRYSDTAGLTLNERLRLFLPVCRAVQSAHGRLVVHRDLKPANVLVTRDGTVKLLDFGIAKLLGDRPSSVEAVETRVGVTPMTPAYAAPEQIAGRPVTTATDIYQLGEILHLLLTGHRAFEDDRGWAAMLARVESHRVRAPSSWATRDGPADVGEDDREATRSATELATLRGTTARRLKRQLSGDLDTIILTAMQTEPERRYLSAEDMARDIERYLSGQPLLAHPDSLSYRFTKLVRRHPLGAVLSTMVAAVMLVLGSRLTQEYRRAELEAAKATAVTDFMVGLFEQPDPEAVAVDTLTVAALLETGALRIEEELVDQPVVQAAVMSAVGRAFLGLGRLDEAEALFEAALERHREHLPPDHPDAASSLEDMGEVKFNRTALDEAEEYFRAALEASRSAYGWRSREVARNLGSLALILHQKGQVDEALATYHEAVETARQAGPLDAESTDILMNLGWLHARQARWQESEALFLEALALRRALLGTGHATVGNALIGLSHVESRTGRLDSALAHSSQALAIFEEVFGSESTRLSGPLISLGNGYLRAGRLDEGEAAYRRALELVSRTWGPSSPNTARINNDLGNLLRDRGQFAESEDHLRAAVAGYDASLGESHYFTGIALNNLASTLGALGRLDEAQEVLERAIGIFEAEGFVESPTMGRALTLLGNLRIQAGEAQAAEGALREALTIWESAETPDPVQLSQTKAQLGRALFLTDRAEEAEPLLTDAYAEMRQVGGEAHPVSRRVAGWLVDLYITLDRPAQADVFRSLSEG
jgi:serine/threonine-protein kinase